MKRLRLAAAFLVAYAAASPTHAEPSMNVQSSEKKEIRHSMMGFRDTLLFYTFKDQKAILKLTIGNKDETFPVHGKLHLFDGNTSTEGMEKWINNQHSDGLFMDAAKPSKTIDLPEEHCAVTKKELTGSSKNPGPGRGEFKEFLIAFSVKEIRIDDTRSIAAFSETARVHVKHTP